MYSSEYVAVSIYNKYMEMKKQKNGVFPPEELERTQNIVRIEIRCMEGKIRALKKKYKVDFISDFMLYDRLVPGRTAFGDASFFRRIITSAEPYC